MEEPQLRGTLSCVQGHIKQKEKEVPRGLSKKKTLEPRYIRGKDKDSDIPQR